VVSGEGKMLGVLSQGDIVKLFFKNIDAYDVAKKTVKELKFGYWYFLSLSYSKTSLTC